MMTSNNRLGIGIVLALGMIISALIVSVAALKIANNRQSVIVKGLAEKSVSADEARWTIRFQGDGENIPQALAALRATRPQIVDYLHAQGFADEALQFAPEEVQAVHKQGADGRILREIESYAAHQSVLVSSTDVKKIEQSAANIIALQEKGLTLVSQGPQFLVSSLEAIKMSLIADATRNAYIRANEFAKTGNTTVGAMKSATQGAFYILPVNGDNSDSDSYGGVYDKATIDKIARVVVTIEYGLTQ